MLENAFKVKIWREICNEKENGFSITIFTHIVMCVQIIHTLVVMDNLFDRFGILARAA